MIAVHSNAVKLRDQLLGLPSVECAKFHSRQSYLYERYDAPAHLVGNLDIRAGSCRSLLTV
jgi:hypothetical protein